MTISGRPKARPEDHWREAPKLYSWIKSVRRPIPGALAHALVYKCSMTYLSVRYPSFDSELLALLERSDRRSGSDLPLRTPVTTSESDCAGSPCGDLTRGGGILWTALLRYSGRHDRQASDSAKMGVRRLGSLAIIAAKHDRCAAIEASIMVLTCPASSQF